jgi:hypothetical protein
VLGLRTTWIAWLLLAAPSGAFAQAATPAPAPAQPEPAPPPATSPAEPAPSTPPPAATEPPPLEQALPPPPPSYQTACVPECRSGFVCMQGQCVSACNPPCDAGQMCTADRMCIANPEARPPRMFPEDMPTPPPDPTAERHDGFFLRLTLGFGSNHFDARAPEGGGVDALGEIANHAKFSGFATHFSFDIGASPIDNLVIAFRLQFATTGEPNQTLDGAHVSPPNDSSIDATLVGPSFTYYFMPIDIYATAAIGWAAINLDDGTDRRSTGSDFGFTFDLGKEFWVGDQWGLGAAVRFNWTSIDNTEHHVPAEYEYFGWGILFSATYQ